VLQSLPKTHGLKQSRICYEVGQEGKMIEQLWEGRQKMTNYEQKIL
jgi:hypothetical protein